MIPFIDLKTQYIQIEEKIKNRIFDVLEHGQYILGPEVKELEDKLAQFVGSNHAIGCANGTDALLIALLALDVGFNDEVIVPDLSFFATCEVVSLIGAKPIFVDIDPKTYTMSPEALRRAITAKTKAIIPVSLYGQCADYDLLNEIAANIPVIEDAAQSFGAEYRGKKSCNLTTIGCTSFFPSKPLGCYGDGGAIFTNDASLATKMRQTLIHGQSERYVHSRIGINGRLDTIQAAILLEKLEIFPEELVRRQIIADRYTLGLKDFVRVPYVVDTNLSAWAQFTIEVENRDKFQESLKRLDIPTAIHYPKTLSEQPVYKDLYSIHNPVSQMAAKKIISLPFHPYLSESEQDTIISSVIKALE